MSKKSKEIISESLNDAHRRPNIPSRPKAVLEAPKSHNQVTTLLKPADSEAKIPVIMGEKFGVRRVFVMDTGCSSDSAPLADAIEFFPYAIRKLWKKITFQTASSPITCNNGVRVRVGVWDVPIDTTLSTGNPNLVAVGLRTMGVGMTFVWVGRKFPCIITSDCRYIVIFDVSNHVPIYAPIFESLEAEFLGTFELSVDAFLDRCGIEVLPTGTVALALKATGAKRGARRPNASACSSDPMTGDDSVAGLNLGIAQIYTPQDIIHYIPKHTTSAVGPRFITLPLS